MRFPFKLYLKEFYIRYNGITLNLEDKNILYTDSDIKIIFLEIEKRKSKGKMLVAIIKNENDILINKFTGTLQNIKNFYKELKAELYGYRYKLMGNPIIIPGEIELKEDDERTFSSFGIRENFTCKVKLLRI